MDAPEVQNIDNAIYTVSHFDLQWHLETDIDRALAQLINLGPLRLERQLNLGVEIVVNSDADQIRINATSERTAMAYPG